MRHVHTPKDRNYIDKGYLEITGDEHEVDEGNEGPKTPSH